MPTSANQQLLYQQLRGAIQSKNEKAILHSLENGADPNYGKSFKDPSKDDFNNSPLMQAAKLASTDEKYKSLFKLLLSRTDDLEPLKHHLTFELRMHDPLHNSSYDWIRPMVVSEELRRPSIQLRDAMQYNGVNEVRTILDNAKNPTNNPHYPIDFNKGPNLISLALSRPHYGDADKKVGQEIALLLIERGYDVNRHIEGGWPPLHTATKYRDDVVVQALLEKGANVNAMMDSSATGGGCTALRLACDERSDSIRDILLEHNADPNCGAISSKSPSKSDFMNSALMHAASRAIQDKDNMTHSSATYLSQSYEDSLRRFQLLLSKTKNLDPLKAHLEELFTNWQNGSYVRGGDNTGSTYHWLKPLLEQEELRRSKEAELQHAKKEEARVAVSPLAAHRKSSTETQGMPDRKSIAAPHISVSGDTRALQPAQSDADQSHTKQSTWRMGKKH